jgi:hypothetical protein
MPQSAPAWCYKALWGSWRGSDTALAGATDAFELTSASVAGSAAGAAQEGADDS